MPMTSAAFIVFTLYMIPDPATTPLKPARQALFGFSVAMVYAFTDPSPGLRALLRSANRLRHPRLIAACLGFVEQVPGRSRCRF